MCIVVAVEQSDKFLEIAVNDVLLVGCSIARDLICDDRMFPVSDAAACVILVS
jgi:hypothetical protein